MITPGFTPPNMNDRTSVADVAASFHAKYTAAHGPHRFMTKSSIRATLDRILHKLQLYRRRAVTLNQGLIYLYMEQSALRAADCEALFWRAMTRIIQIENSTYELARKAVIEIPCGAVRRYHPRTMTRVSRAPREQLTIAPYVCSHPDKHGMDRLRCIARQFGV